MNLSGSSCNFIQRISAMPDQLYPQSILPGLRTRLQAILIPLLLSLGEGVGGRGLHADGKEAYLECHPGYATGKFSLTTSDHLQHATLPESRNGLRCGSRLHLRYRSRSRSRNRRGNWRRRRRFDDFLPFNHCGSRSFNLL